MASRKLATLLEPGCTGRLEFAATSAARAVLGGLGNTDSPAWGSVERGDPGGGPFLVRSAGAGVHLDLGPPAPDDIRDD